MKRQKFTTEDTEKKNFRFKNSVNSMVVFFSKEYLCSKLKNGVKRLIL